MYVDRGGAVGGGETVGRDVYVDRGGAVGGGETVGRDVYVDRGGAVGGGETTWKYDGKWRCNCRWVELQVEGIQKEYVRL